jgi:dihydrodipicolinate synthase/N-acetylneuraminate lyase
MSSRVLSVRGVIPNLIIPFAQDGHVLMDVVGREITYLDQTGVDAISIGAFNSETAGSTADELFRICETARRSTRKPLFATILPDSELEAVELLDAVINARVDALLVAQPHYLFQPDGASLTKMFERLRPRTSRPILLANLITTAPVDLETMTRMVEDSIVDGIVQGGDAHQLVDLLRFHPSVPIFSAIEDLHLVALLLGGAGLISGLATVFPNECVALYRDLAKKNYEGAREKHERLLRLWHVLDHPVEQLSRVRVALAAQGRDVGSPRSPYSVMAEESSLEVRRALTREGVRAPLEGL